MINPQDLRIGNYVEYNGIIDKISQIYDRIIHTEQFSSLNPNELNYIDLNDEWLIKFGLDKGSDIIGDCWFTENPIYDLDFAIYVTDDGYELINRKLKIVHVHQLQNLFFSLTQLEL